MYPVAKSNIVLLVGGPPTPAFAENKVVIWDDATGQIVAELEFDDKVRGLAARRDRLAVALRRRVVVFVLGQGPNGLWREGTYETYDNPLGKHSFKLAVQTHTDIRLLKQVLSLLRQLQDRLC